MTRVWKTALSVTAAVVAVTVAGIGRADDFKPEEGFTSLFNGKDLTGWTYGGASLDGKTETPDQRFQVVDGVIVAQAKDKDGKTGTKDLNSKSKYPKNFVFKVEFRASEKADSGVYIRGPQLQVRDYARRKEHLADLGKVFKNDDWNELEISVNGIKTVMTVNGKAIEAKDEFELAVKDGKRVGKLNGKELEVAAFQFLQFPNTTVKLNGVVYEKNFKAGPAGGVGLQAETGKFEFRRVRIKETD